MELLATARRLARATGALRFGPPVTHVYNPLDYAWEPHSRYLRRFGSGTREVVLLGMNPGPFGMAQTGVPFGEVQRVRDWLGITGKVRKPRPEHPKRPVLGFDCARSEVSGARLWDWARAACGTPERFFERFFIANYCPLVFLEESGRNRTPDKLPASEREALFAACDAALLATVERLQPRILVGIGKFAENRARRVLEGTGIEVGVILHPSPASPQANRGWAPQAERQLRALGISLPGARPSASRRGSAARAR